MKEASGEANITILTVLLIGIVALVATPLITNIMNSTSRQSCCTTAGGEWRGGDCRQNSNGTFDRTTYDSCLEGIDDND